MESLKHKNKVAGLKQVRNAVLHGEAETVYIAEDADVICIKPIIQLCGENNIEVVCVNTRKELGKACGLDVPAAAVAVINS